MALRFEGCGPSHLVARDDLPMPEPLDGGRPIGAAIAPPGTVAAAGMSPAGAISGGMSHVRWGICALLFFATTINYVDRGVLGVLEPELRKTIKWTNTQY